MLDFEMAEFAYEAARLLGITRATGIDPRSLSKEDVLQESLTCLQLIEKLSGMYAGVSSIVG